MVCDTGFVTPEGCFQAVLEARPCDVYVRPLRQYSRVTAKAATKARIERSSGTVSNWLSKTNLKQRWFGPFMEENLDAN